MGDMIYSRNGAYFITVCTYERQTLFGVVSNGTIVLNTYGLLAKQELLKSQSIRKEINIDYFIVMPNHLHFILSIDSPSVGPYGNTALPESMIEQEQCSNDNDQCRPYVHTALRSPSKNVGAMVRGFKAVVTTEINRLRNTPRQPVWQPGYYDHIIRNYDEYLRCAKYIETNPLRWELDRFYTC